MLTSMLLPPPLEDFADTETTPDDPWESTHISRLALEDVSAGLNPSENLTDLAQHYLDFALHLEERGWLKQASLNSQHGVLCFFMSNINTLVTCTKSSIFGMVLTMKLTVLIQLLDMTGWMPCCLRFQLNPVGVMIFSIDLMNLKLRIASEL